VQSRSCAPRCGAACPDPHNSRPAAAGTLSEVPGRAARRAGAGAPGHRGRGAGAGRLRKQPRSLARGPQRARGGARGRRPGKLCRRAPRRRRWGRAVAALGVSVGRQAPDGARGAAAARVTPPNAPPRSQPRCAGAGGLTASPCSDSTTPCTPCTGRHVDQGGAHALHMSGSSALLLQRFARRPPQPAAEHVGKGEGGLDRRAAAARSRAQTKARHCQGLHVVARLGGRGGRAARRPALCTGAVGGSARRQSRRHGPRPDEVVRGRGRIGEPGSRVGRRRLHEQSPEPRS